MSDSTQSPSHTLLTLLSRDKSQTARTILVTGPWGCGKTFFWKHEVIPKLKRPNIYVSAFGAESPGSLKGRLLTNFAIGILGRAPLASGILDNAPGLWSKIRERLGRPGQTIAATLNSLGSSFLRRADVDPLELAGLIEESTIICIDDIERVSASFRFEDLLGVINVLCEHKGLDVVLICNEEHIKNDDTNAKTYLRHKEKAISAELHISADLTSMFDRVAESAVSSEAALERIRMAKPVILEVFSRSNTENLRILARVCMSLETVFAAGIRELREKEIRFLTAVTIHRASEVDAPQDDQFFAFDPYSLEITSRLAAPSKPEDPRTIARKSFLERYFGDTDYDFHPGLYEVARRGRVDSSKFIEEVAPDLAGTSKTLAEAWNGGWRYWGDARVAELQQALVSHIEKGDTATARETLECLAYSRILAEILESSIPPTATVAARRMLEEMASRQDMSLGVDWEMPSPDLSARVNPELEAFRAASTLAQKRLLSEEFRKLIASRDLGTVLLRISRSDLTTLRVVLEEIGLDAMMELRKTNDKRFDVLVRTLFEQIRAFSVSWEPAGGFLEGLVQRLRALADDPSEEHMTRWRLRGLLSRMAPLQS